MRRLLLIAALTAALLHGSTAEARPQAPQSQRWSHVLRAASQAASGRIDRALLTLAYTRRSGDTPALATAAALCRLLRGDVQGARKQMQTALKLGGSYVDGHYWAAVIAARAGQPAEARTALHRALTLGGDRPRFLMLQILLAKGAGQPAVARLALAKLVRKHCELLDPALYPDPLAGLTDAMLHTLRAFPHKAPPLITAGNLMMMTRRYRQAFLYFQRAQKHQPRNAGLLLRLARLAMVDGDAPTALRLLDRGLAIAPGAGDLRSAKAEVLITLGRSTQARAQLELAVKANPNSAIDLSRLGDQLWGAGAYDRAERLYQYALRQQGGLASARYGVARALDRNGRYKEAERSYRAAVVLNPANQRYHLALALFHEKRGRAAEGVKSRQRAQRAQALAAQLRLLERQATAVGGVARQVCRVANARAVKAAQIMLRHFRAAPAIRAYLTAYLEGLSGRTNQPALTTVLAGLKPARLLTPVALPTELTVQGLVEPGVPVILKRYLSFLDPRVLR
ncbi:MAG: tetratricopeptide repeat protein [bacterium]